jgi:thioredoxin-related protein
MKASRLLLVFFASLILAAPVIAEDGKKTEKGGTPPPPAKKEINWQAYDQGLTLAKKQNKHVFIDFTAKWCGWCKKMDKEAFANDQVIALLNNDFVAVRVDGDSENILNVDGYKISEKNLARSDFGVRGYPSFWFLKSDGTKLGNLAGYQTTENLLKTLTWVKDYQYDTTRTEQRSHP